MIQWVTGNVGTIIVSAVMLVAFILALRYIHKTKKSGGCAGCLGGSSCSHCSGHEVKKEK